MAAGSNVELSIGAVLENSVEIYVHNQFASETGEVIVFDSNSTEVARSSTITVYQSSTSVTITGLDGGTEYTAKFYSETVGDYSLSTLDFTTLRHNKLYGPVNSQATRVSEFYGPVNGEAELANKVYGSVNGQAKIIHQGFGHHDYGYGILTYFTDANHTQTNMVELSSYNLRRLSGYYSSTRQTWNVTINGVTIRNKDIYGVILTNKVTSLPPYFLSGCEALNSPLKLPPTLTSISDSGETNGSAFLFACKNMLAPIDVGSLSPSIVKSITPHSFSASDANAPAYTIGMTIVGANRAEWLSAFPNQGALIYRKLIDGGY